MSKIRLRQSEILFLTVRYYARAILAALTLFRGNLDIEKAFRFGVQYCFSFPL